jgi:AcrR family transcriptional regulator
MQSLFSNIKIQVPEKLYLKDPESSDLGRKIVEHSIKLIEELGFDNFTFKKLGDAIGSPESTIYRYFENKHKLLIYLTSWYWGWLEYKLVFATANVEPAERKLTKALEAVTETAETDQQFSHIDETLLQKIVMAESTKAFLTKEVEEENKQGYFNNYRRLSERLSDIVLEVNPKFEFAHTLISTVLEGCHLQKFFGRHLPGLTDTAKNDEAVSAFFIALTFSMISK